MVAWEQFERSNEDLAREGKRILLLGKSSGAGLAYLATARSDGAPRVHPISPTLIDGHLYAFVLRASPKVKDLAENPRYALHSFPDRSLYIEERFNDEEFYLSGIAIPVTDATMRQVVASTVGDALELGDLFELSIERAMRKHREKGRGTVYTKWKASETGDSNLRG